MAVNFYTLITTTGKSKMANAAALGTKVNFKTLKVGDGNGNYYEPTENQTNLLNTVWQGNIGSISIDENNSSWIVTETTIPATDGGFFIREAGIFDEDGDLIAISKMAETYKPVAAEGSTKNLLVQIILEVSNSSSVTLKIDPNVVIATKNDIQILTNSINSINTQLSEKANDTDSARTTTSKTVTGAINELSSSKAKQTDLAQLSNPNLIINGDFQIDQRHNFGVATGNGYLIDRWYMWTSVSPSLQSAHSSLYWTLGGNDNLIQMIELPNRNYCKNFTLSFIIKGKSTTTISITVSDSISVTSGGTQLATTNHTCNGNYELVTLSVPTHIYAGCCRVSFSSSSIGDTIELTEVKLEVGSLKTPFVSRPYAEELALCQRYYRKFWLAEIASIFITASNVRITFPVIGMRIVPSSSFNNLQYCMYEGSNWLSDISFNYATSNTTYDSATYTMFEFKTTTTYAVSNICRINAMVMLDAEMY